MMNNILYKLCVISTLSMLLLCVLNTNSMGLGEKDLEKHLLEIKAISQETANTLSAVAAQTAADVSARASYYYATHEAKEPTKVEQVKELQAITPDEPLIFNQDKTKVLVASWVPNAYLGSESTPDTYLYALKTGEPLVIKWDAWVTVVPEAQNFIQKYVQNPRPGLTLRKRIMQWLGLNVNANYPRSFVHMWVPIDQLFRPCLDPKVDDNACQPEEDGVGVANTEHIEWYNRNKSSAFDPDSAVWYPWTRLGYTYDYGAIGLERKGASEFVIKKDTPVIIESITPTDQYAAKSLTSIQPVS